MARRRRIGGRSRSRGRRRNLTTLIAAVGVCVLCLGIVAAFAWYKITAPSRTALDTTTLCPLGGPAAVTVVLLDATDDLPEVARQELATYLRDAAEALPQHALLELRLLDPSVPGGRIVFSRCNPGDGSNLSEIDANPARVRARWLEGFRTPLEKALADLKPATAEVSPIMAALQRIAVERFSGRAAEAIPKRLIVVSDMLENAPGYSQYKGDFAYARFKASPAYKRLHTNLNGAAVVIRYVQRLKGQADSGAHIRFWVDWVADNNGRFEQATKLQGAG